MAFRRVTACAAAAAALVPAALIAAAPAHADSTAPDPSTLPSCYDVSTAYGDYAQNSLRSDVQGIPRTIVAGKGWYDFTATVTNIGAKDLPNVLTVARAWNQTESDSDPNLGQYATVEYQSPGGQWSEVPNRSWGKVDSIGTLAAKTTRTYKLRFKVAADAPKLLLSGDMSFEVLFPDTYTYPDTHKTVDCAGTYIGFEGFGIEPAGGTGTPTGGSTATPTPTHTTGSGTPATTAAVPAGSNSPGPQLAATGSSGTLPVVGGLAAAALAAGAGTLVANRRRQRAH